MKNEKFIILLIIISNLFVLKAQTTKIDFTKGIAESLRLIGIYYKTKADYPKALEYHKIFKQMSDSLINEGNIKKLAAYEINKLYEKEKLSVTNFELREKEEEIIQQAEEVKIISEKLRESNFSLGKKVKTRTKELKIVRKNKSGK